MNEAKLRAIGTVVGLIFGVGVLIASILWGWLGVLAIVVAVLVVSVPIVVGYLMGIWQRQRQAPTPLDNQPQ